MADKRDLLGTQEQPAIWTLGSLSRKEERDPSDDTQMTSLDELVEPEFEIADPDIAHLVVFAPSLSGSAAGQTHVIRDQVIIGRSPDADIHVETADVSRHHAIIKRVAPGKFVIKDLGSRNGTTVNDVPVKESILSPGDKIKIGIRTILIFARYHPLETQLIQSQKLESLGRLAAGVAHEINNPLTYVYYNLESLTAATSKIAHEMINGLHQIMMVRGRLAQHLPADEIAALMGSADEGMDPETLEALSECLSEAKDGVRRIMSIVQDLKSFSRSGEERLVPLDINEAIEDATRIARNEIRFRAQLVREYGDVPPVLGNEGRLTQVFLNLLTNAAHAIREGNVDQNTIVVRTWAAGDEVAAKIQDTGEGVPTDQLEHIFEPFYTTKAAGRGSGLGLSICHSIVNSHGGRIEVESQQGSGTSFIVYLPKTSIQRVARQTAESAPVKEQEATARGRVLIIDDEPGICAALKRTLTHEHDVEVAVSGVEAKHLLEKDLAFDVILCDLMMPQVTGMDLYHWLRERNPQAAEQLVFMTGGAFTRQSEDFIRQVANSVVEKPIELTALFSLIREKLQRKTFGR